MPFTFRRIRGPRDADRARLPFAIPRRSGLVAAVALTLQTQAARPDEGWRASAGPALVVAPQYPGSRGELTLPLPMVDVSYGPCLFLNTDRGLGAYVVNHERLQVGTSLWFRRGRYHDESSRIAELGDIDTTAQGRLFASYTLGPITFGTTLARDFDGSSGLTIDASVAWRLQLSPSARISLGAQGSYGNSAYMQSWFGVTADQARASGLPGYAPGAGFRSVGPSASLNYVLSPRWTVRAQVSEDFLVGKAANSPIVGRNLPTVAVGAVYRFLP